MSRVIAAALILFCVTVAGVAVCGIATVKIHQLELAFRQHAESQPRACETLSLTIEARGARVQCEVRPEGPRLLP